MPLLPDPTPLPRLSVAPKTGAWSWWQRLQSKEGRRRAFSYAILNPDLRLDDEERLGRMRTLIDLGLWGDHGEMDKRTFIEERRALGYDILRAHREGLCSVEVLHLALEGGVDPNWHERNHHDDSFFTLFARHNQPDCMERVLDAGANPRWRDTCEDTALHILIDHACMDEEIKANLLPVVDRLLARGVDINDQGQARHENDRGEPAIQAAIEAWDVDLVQWMLDRGARLDVEDAYGNTPFHWAAMSRRGWGDRHIDPLLELLHKHGAPLDAANGRGETPVWAAMAWKNDDVGGWLLEHGASAQCVPHTRQDSQGYEYRGENGPGLLQVFCQNTALNEKTAAIIPLLTARGSDVWNDPTPEGAPLYEVLRANNSAWLAFVEAGLLDQAVDQVAPAETAPRARPRL